MKKITFLLLIVASLNSFADVKLISWDEKEGQRRLSTSNYKTDFFKLTNNFIAQDNKLACGLASSSIVLNALRLRTKENIPEDSSSINEKEKSNISFNPFFQRYSQSNVLNEKTKSREEVFGKLTKVNGEMKKDFGLQLTQLAAVFESHNTKVIKRIVTSKSSKKQIMQEILKNLQTENDYVLVNYSRKELGQPGGGHISPIGAYDKKTDSFLIMDVNPNKAPWVWVKSDDLINAMNTFDTVENRGYLLIADK